MARESHEIWLELQETTSSVSFSRRSPGPEFYGALS
jgi:hypothetical protein